MPLLHWLGKDKIVNYAQKAPFHLLEKRYQYGDNAHNKIIHGDNLLALKSLLPQYENKIKCIYIDPPYNTGNENWVYNDNVNSPQIQKWLGQVVGKPAEDFSRHDKWLCMMYPRLQLLRRLLADNGVIFISIDDNEQANLKLICDEIFGGDNFISNIIWQRAYAPVNLKKTFSQNHDFVLCYSKNLNNFNMKGLQRSVEADDRYKNPDNDPRGVWKSDNLSVGPAVAANIYEIITPTGRKVLPPKGRSWVLNKERLAEFIADNRIWFGNQGDATPSLKRFLSEVKDGITPMTVWTYQEVGHTQDAKKEIKAIFSESEAPFDTPKTTRLLERIFQLTTDSNDLILDSFAGSGTTAHAVLNLNKVDGGNRQFILIECEDYAETITAERVRRVMAGYGEVAGLGGGFEYYELGQALFLENGFLNEEVPTEQIKEYVYYTETQQAYKPHDGQYSMGEWEDRSYYFYYEKDSECRLDMDFLATINYRSRAYTIYADICGLSEAQLEKYNVIYKKIPRDISRL